MQEVSADFLIEGIRYALCDDAWRQLSTLKTPAQRGCAAADGAVAKVLAATGETLTVGQPIVEFAQEGRG